MSTVSYIFALIFLKDCVMIIGSDKGYIYPYDIMTDVKTKKVGSNSI